MLNTEQSIEVAEKVWGWKTQVKGAKGKDWFHQYIDPAGISHIITSDSPVEAQVNSWSGFGRTVEAMAEKDLILIIDPSIGFCQAGRTTYDGGLVQKRSSEEIWESTHLAALGAIAP